MADVTSKRMAAAERRARIVTAARRVFSQHGFDRGRTLDVAQEAGVSEALVFSYFRSKLGLFRAVLRQVFREQDQRWREQGIRGESTADLVLSVYRFLRESTREGEDARRSDSRRMTLASLARDGSYASLIYRRSQRRNLRSVEAAFNAARERGDMVGEPLAPSAASMFMEHVGTMMAAICALPAHARPYGLTDEELVRQATWFCLRGSGLSDEVIRQHLPDGNDAEEIGLEALAAD